MSNGNTEQGTSKNVTKKKNNFVGSGKHKYILLKSFNADAAQ